MKIDARGVIVDTGDKDFYDYFGIPCIAPSTFDDALNSGEDLVIDLNSEGGLVTAAAEIYTKFLKYPGKITVNITGLAASAASVITMAADEVCISPVGRLMIHNVSGGGTGDFHDMDKLSDILKQSNDILAEAYAKKTGLNRDEVLAMMDKETWLDAEKAIELGFADKMIERSKDDSSIELVASVQNPIPKVIIDKFNELINENKELKEKNAVEKGLLISKDDLKSAIAEVVNNQKKTPEPKNLGFGAFIF